MAFLLGNEGNGVNPWTHRDGTWEDFGDVSTYSFAPDGICNFPVMANSSLKKF